MAVPEDAEASVTEVAEDAEALVMVVAEAAAVVVLAEDSVVAVAVVEDRVDVVAVELVVEENPEVSRVANP